MLGISSSEFIVILILLIIILNPKDWPKLVRTLGRWSGKAQRIYHAILNDVQDLMDTDDPKS